MTTFTYSRDLPESNNNPSVDQPDMKINTNSIDDLINVDHNSFGVANGGYHKVIHEITQGADPVTIAGINQVYSKLYIPDSTVSVADTQLFAKTGLGGVSQLTGNFSTAEGYQWLGGTLIQWGTVVNAIVNNTSGSVTFKDRVAGAIPFPTNCFCVFATLTSAGGTPTGPGSVSIRTNLLSNTGFSWRGQTVSVSPFTGFFWVAIGN